MADLLKSACFCGCGGSPKSPESAYLPGHDAKHVAKLVEAYRAADGPDKSAHREAVIRHAEDMLSEALFRQLWERLFW
jgi:hypothetical protein